MFGDDDDDDDDDDDILAFQYSRLWVEKEKRKNYFVSLCKFYLLRPVPVKKI